MGAVNTPGMQVNVRMYRQGLGDCFLLSFTNAGTKSAFHMLVDCGVVIAHKQERDHKVSPTFKQVAEEIAKTTGGTIDLLVVTHEHWDHLSGFLDSGLREVFSHITVKNIWMGWTEDPHDKDAKQLKQKLGKTHLALRLALERASEETAQPIRHVLNFLGASATGTRTTSAAMDNVRKLLKQGEPKYHDPAQIKQPLTLTDLPGVRFYVLGPPRDLADIKRRLPRSGESYVTQMGAQGAEALLTKTRAFLQAAYCMDGAPPSDDRDLFNLSFPFNENLRIPRPEAEKIEFFKSHYYDDPDAGWRRIDDEWLGLGEELALALDNYTNNTSLALAIELTKSGKVIILAADAQVGNWQSWKKLEWTIKEDGAEKKVTIDDLLARAVLYKVGHHGSVNASFKPLVDLITNPNLVTLLPVDHDDAVSMRWNDMPWQPLLKHLGNGDGKASRVIVRIDQLPTKRPAGMPDADWSKFKAHLVENDLYMQYTVDDLA